MRGRGRRDSPVSAEAERPAPAERDGQDAQVARGERPSSPRCSARPPSRAPRRSRRAAGVWGGSWRTLADAATPGNGAPPPRIQLNSPENKPIRANRIEPPQRYRNRIISGGTRRCSPPKEIAENQRADAGAEAGAGVPAARVEVGAADRAAGGVGRDVLAAVGATASVRHPLTARKCRAGAGSGNCSHVQPMRPIERSGRRVRLECHVPSPLRPPARAGRARRRRAGARRRPRRVHQERPPARPGHRPRQDRRARPRWRSGSACEHPRPAQEAALAAAQQDPASPDYRHYLSPAQYAQRFGVDAATFQRTLSWLKAGGATVQVTSPSRDFVEIKATVAQVDQLFGTEIHDYAAQGTRFIANRYAPSVPADADVLAIMGLNTLVHPTIPHEQRAATGDPAGRADAAGHVVDLRPARRQHRRRAVDRRDRRGRLRPDRRRRSARSRTTTASRTSRSRSRARPRTATTPTPAAASSGSSTRRPRPAWRPTSAACTCTSAST